MSENIDAERSSNEVRHDSGDDQGEQLKMVSLFSGGGGLDLGLEAVGFQSLFVSDIDEHSCKTLVAGKKEAQKRGKPFLREAIIQQADISNLSGQSILQRAGLKPGEVDLLAGGPPCQAYSVFGQRKGLEDPRGKLSFEYLRLLSEIRPKAFIFENVYGLLTIDKGRIFEELCQQLSNPKKGLKYELSVFRLNARDFGVPQHRDRVFIIGSQSGRKVQNISALTGDESDLAFRTVGDALRGLPPMGHESVSNHTGRKHSQRIIDRYSGMSAGERDKHTRINKLDPSKPSFTIIVGSDAGGGKGHIHPKEPREVTPRESARIQTFPDWWAFSGTSRHPIRQVGNAVPPLLAAAIGNEIRKDLYNLPAVPIEEIIELLDQQHLFNK